MSARAWWCSSHRADGGHTRRPSIASRGAPTAAPPWRTASGPGVAGPAGDGGTVPTSARPWQRRREHDRWYRPQPWISRPRATRELPAPRVGDTIWHYRSDRASVVVSVHGPQAQVVFTLRCRRCNRGMLTYSDQRWSRWCPVCQRCYSEAELRALAESLTCSTRGCQREHHARGLCVSCYERWRPALPARRALKRDWQQRPEVKRRRNAAEREAWPRRRAAHAAARRERRRRQREATRDAT